MFALIDSAACLHFTVGESNRGRYEGARSEKHGRMPYHMVSDEVLVDDDGLFARARELVALSKS